MIDFSTVSSYLHKDRQDVIVMEIKAELDAIFGSGKNLHVTINLVLMTEHVTYYFLKEIFRCVIKDFLD